jgi:hypothetical protein
VAARHGVARLAVTATHAAMHVEVPDAPIVGLGRFVAGARRAEVLGAAVVVLREGGWRPDGAWVLMCDGPGVLVFEAGVVSGPFPAGSVRRRGGRRRRVRPPPAA